VRWLITASCLFPPPPLPSPPQITTFQISSTLSKSSLPSQSLQGPALHPQRHLLHRRATLRFSGTTSTPVATRPHQPQRTHSRRRCPPSPSSRYSVSSNALYSIHCPLTHLKVALQFTGPSAMPQVLSLDPFHYCLRQCLLTLIKSDAQFPLSSMPSSRDSSSLIRSFKPFCSLVWAKSSRVTHQVVSNVLCLDIMKTVRQFVAYHRQVFCKQIRPVFVHGQNLGEPQSDFICIFTHICSACSVNFVRRSGSAATWSMGCELIQSEHYIFGDIFVIVDTSAATCFPYNAYIFY
jgi:hypothetical protein